MKRTLFLLALGFTSLLGNAQTAAPAVTNVATAGTLTVSVTTLRGNLAGYSPSNIMAIWVVDGSGVFVKTLLAQAATRKSDLLKWKAATSTNNVVDAITGATQSSYGARTCTWNGTNVSKVVVPDGNYTVWMEVTDDAVQGPFTSFTFAKGTTAVTLSPTALTNFSGISIKWVPVNTAVNDVKIGSQYSVYPNPTRSVAYVSGFDILEVEVCTLSGKTVFTTNEQQLNLTALPKGIYLAKVYTKKGNFIKKIEKL